MKYFFAFLAALLAAIASNAQTPAQNVRATIGGNVLLTPIVGSTSAPVYSAPVGSIEALRLINVTKPSLANGVSIQVQGYYAANDGGGGVYVWNSNSTGADDGGTVIQSTGVATGRWILLYNGNLSVKQFGAYGDGTHDDTIALVNALKSSRTVYAPAGSYKITATISLDDVSDLTIRGDGYQTKFVDAIPTHGPELFLVDAGHAANRVVFDSVCFYHSDTTNGSPELTMYSCNDVRVQNCTFERGQLKLVGATNVFVARNTIRNWNSDRSGVIVQGNDIVVSNNLIVVTENQSSDDALVISAPSTKVSVTGNIIDKSANTTGYDRNGILIYRGTGTTTLREIAITGNVISGFAVVNANTISGLQLSPDTGGGSIVGLTVTGNSFKDCLIATYLNQFASAVVVSGNTFVNCSVAFQSENGGHSKGQLILANNVAQVTSTATNAFLIAQGDGGLIISGNSFKNYTNGVSVSVSSFLTVTGNHFDGCTNGVSCTNIVGLSCSGNLIQNGTNLVKFVTQGFGATATMAANSLSSTTNLYTDSTGGVVSVISTDTNPRFVGNATITGNISGGADLTLSGAGGHTVNITAGTSGTSTVNLTAAGGGSSVLQSTGGEFDLSTTDANDIVFKRQGTERARVGATGLSIQTQTPASAGATGSTGTIAWDANFIYICTASNTWKRVGIATW